MWADVIPGSDLLTDFLKVSPVGAAVIVVCWMFLKALDKREDKCAEQTNRIVESFQEEMAAQRTEAKDVRDAHEKHWSGLRDSMHKLREDLQHVCPETRKLGS